MKYVCRKCDKLIEDKEAVTMPFDVSYVYCKDCYKKWNGEEMKR
jgi:hypothetical protein